MWEVSSMERLFARNFQVWDLGKCSMALKVRPLLLVFLS